MLVVEDNELVTGALRILFEETGHRVSVAHSVAQAVTVGATDAVDLVLLDLSLPDGDGLSVLAELEKRGARPAASLALTGRDDGPTLDRCAAAGVSGVFLKPVPTKDLLAKSRELLGRRD